MMKTLVTGATGFVGSWLVRHLVQAGHQVRILQRPSQASQVFPDLPLERHQGDILNLNSLISATEGCDVVFHLAGLVGYSRSMRVAMEEVNVLGTANVIAACREQPSVQRLVHFSSVVTVGASHRPDQVLNEDSPYDLSQYNLGYFETKRKAEQLVVQAVKDGLIDAVMVNPSTIYGAGDSTKGSRSVQLKVARGRFPYYTCGGVNVVHIEDVIQGAVAALERGRSGQRYILAGENILIKDLFKEIAQTAQVKTPWIYLPKPLVLTIGKIGDALEKCGLKGPLNSENARTSILYHWFDSSLAQKELDFKARPARGAIQESIRWSKEQGLI